MPSPGSTQPVPLTVLLVDDEEAMRAIIASMLEMLGFKVLVACDGREALQMGQPGQPEFQLAFCDFRMPGLDGVDTLAALRELHPGLRMILCSGYPPADCLQGRPLGDCVFLGKPFGLKDLTAAVARAMA